MNDQKKQEKALKRLFFGWFSSSPVSAPANKLTPDMEIAFWRSKAEQLESEKKDLQDQYDTLKKHADQLSNRILDLEKDQREFILNEFDLKLQKLTTKDKIVCITTKHKSLLDHKMFAQINHALRTRCPWLDLVFMIHEDVELKTLTDEDLKTVGLQRVVKKNDDGSGGVLC